MSTFQLRSDSVEIEGRVMQVWADDSGYSPSPLSLNWHLVVQLNPGDVHLVTADGKINPFDWIECQVTPIKGFAGGLRGNQILPDLMGQRVRLAGSWGDRVESGSSISTLLWPIEWILVDRGLAPIVQEQGFTQVIRDADVFAFSDDTDPLSGAIPPHHREDRHVVVDIPFPFPPQPSLTPVFTECLDYEDKEQVLYGFRSNAFPAYPIHADRQHSFSVVQGAAGASLRVNIDTGTPAAGQGFFHAKFTLSFDEPFERMCNPNVCLQDPSQSCQYTGKTRFTFSWPKIDSALPGTLLLGPAETSGVLGSLLGALKPAQFYDHMVMFVEDDRETIRHCTASDERIVNDAYYSDEVKFNFFGGQVDQRVPVRGIREDILKFEWPGTITQTLGEVCITGRNHSNLKFSFSNNFPEVIAEESRVGLHPLLRELPPSERDKRTSFHDSEAAAAAKSQKKAGKRAQYSLTRLQKDPAFRPEQDRLIPNL